MPDKPFSIRALLRPNRSFLFFLFPSLFLFSLLLLVLILLPVHLNSAETAEASSPPFVSPPDPAVLPHPFLQTSPFSLAGTLCPCFLLSLLDFFLFFFFSLSLLVIFDFGYTLSLWVIHRQKRHVPLPVHRSVAVTILADLPMVTDISQRAVAGRVVPVGQICRCWGLRRRPNERSRLWNTDAKLGKNVRPVGWRENGLPE